MADLYVNKPLIILGMHRSGTSMITRTLNLTGLYIGPEEHLMEPSPANPDGYWENWLFANINDELLGLYGTDWKHPQSQVIDWTSHPDYPIFRHRVETLLAPYTPNSFWGWKDPRNTLTLGFWLTLLPQAHVLLCLRNPIEVALSMSKRNESPIAYDDSLEMWLNYHKNLLRTIDSNQIIVTHYESYFYNPQQEISRVANILGLNPQSETLALAVDSIKQDYRRNQIPDLALRVDSITDELWQIYDSFCLKAGDVFHKSQQDASWQTRKNIPYLKEMKEKLTAKDQLIAAREQQLVAKDQHLAAKDQHLAAKDQHLAAREQHHRNVLEHTRNQVQVEINQLQNQIHQQIIAKEQAHRALQRDLQQRIEGLNNELVAHQQNIEGLNQELAARQQHIEGLNQELVARQQHIEGLNNELSAVNSRAQNMTIQFTRAQTELTDIYATRGWRMLSNWWAFKRRVLPSGSRRERAYHLARTATGTLIKGGPIAFVKRMYRWLTGERRYYHVTNPELTNTIHQITSTQENSVSETPNILQAAIDISPDEYFAVGDGGVIHFTGWCVSSESRITKLNLLLGDNRTPIRKFGRPRLDVMKTLGNDKALYSGFRVNVPVEPVLQPRTVSIVLEAEYDTGQTQQLLLKSVTLQPTIIPIHDKLSIQPPFPEDGAFIVVCMTTYNPNEVYLREQIESLTAQTHRNWVCIITDDCSNEDIFSRIESIVSVDKRFYLYRNSHNLGFYHNFENCLTLVPENAEFVALCDQDDYWYPEKLSRLLDGFDDETTLVYSDMKIVSENRDVVSTTFWTSRKNNYERLDWLLFANTITGAASLFRASLLSSLLPFPQRIYDLYHDHWLGIVALSTGYVRYIDEPLYEYRQHSANVIGQWTKHYTGEDFEGIVLDWQQKAKNNHAFTHPVWSKLIQANLSKRTTYLAFFLQKRLQKNTRVNELLQQLINFEHDFKAFEHWCSQQSAAEIMLGLHQYALHGLQVEELLSQSQQVPILTPNIDTPDSKHQNAREKLQFSSDIQSSQALHDFLNKKIAPLNLIVDTHQHARVNVLTSTIDFKYFFGGYIAVTNLARQLNRHGHSVRLILTDHTDFNPTLWRQQISQYGDLADFFDKVEVAYCYDRTMNLIASPQDAFIGTSWWTAHIAHAATLQLGQPFFVYLTQEYEPVFYPHDTIHALAMASYMLPHRALYSTELLRQYARQQRIGVFANDLEQGDKHSISFENAITSYAASRITMGSRKRKRLLFYARPEQHAERNAFILGLMALQRAISAGAFDISQWEFHGVGASKPSAPVPLGYGAELKILPKVGLDEYHHLLTEYDVGLSLMLTPHPSLVPLDMAAAGQLVVTNTFENKTADAMAAISSNIYAVAPTVEALSNALREVTQYVNDYDARLTGSQLNWARSWEQSLNDRIMAQLNEWLSRERISQ